MIYSANVGKNAIPVTQFLPLEDDNEAPPLSKDEMKDIFKRAMENKSIVSTKPKAIKNAKPRRA